MLYSIVPTKSLLIWLKIHDRVLNDKFQSDVNPLELQTTVTLTKSRVVDIVRSTICYRPNTFMLIQCKECTVYPCIVYRVVYIWADIFEVKMDVRKRRKKKRQLRASKERYVEMTG